MSTVLSRKLRLAITEDTPGEQALASVPVLRRVELSQVAAPEPGAVPAWDPHEVWLNRVKKPRDARGG